MNNKKGFAPNLTNENDESTAAVQFNESGTPADDEGTNRLRFPVSLNIDEDSNRIRFLGTDENESIPLTSGQTPSNPKSHVLPAHKLKSIWIPSPYNSRIIEAGSDLATIEEKTNEEIAVSPNRRLLKPIPSRASEYTRVYHPQALGRRIRPSTWAPYRKSKFQAISSDSKKYKSNSSDVLRLLQREATASPDWAPDREGGDNSEGESGAGSLLNELEDTGYEDSDSGSEEDRSYSSNSNDSEIQCTSLPPTSNIAIR
ncbi:hypothetical protein FRB95_014191 [Tulasnella sp. JGI-2019a]|nr:hypothetical protein FRB95_014191 [Tulasnella sp. JGI-2019a]